MTGPEHYREAERLIVQANAALRDQGTESQAKMLAHRMLTDQAQVHATLALAAATAQQVETVLVHDPRWREVIGP
jgi:hypothetical protein